MASNLAYLDANGQEVDIRNLGRAMQAFRDLDYGGVMINDVPTFRVDNFPYGGTKDSGFGREGVRFAMDEMSEPKVLVMRGL